MGTGAGSAGLPTAGGAGDVVPRRAGGVGAAVPIPCDILLRRPQQQRSAVIIFALEVLSMSPIVKSEKRGVADV